VAVHKESIPLPALLSQALVAFTIEFDDEFKHRMPVMRSARGESQPLKTRWTSLRPATRASMSSRVE
jgi:hypothetical protein